MSYLNDLILRELFKFSCFESKVIIVRMRLVALTFLLTFHIVYVHASNNRIVGGKDTSDGEFPYQVSLQYKTQHFCGGSLISEEWIVTAAHCKLDVDPIEAVAGEHDFKSDSGEEQRRTVTEFIIHEKYKGNDGNNNVSPDDIAVVKVDSPFELGSRVTVVGLPEPDTYPSGKGVVSGWGSVSREPGEYPDILQVSKLLLLGK